MTRVVALAAVCAALLAPAGARAAAPAPKAKAKAPASKKAPEPAKAPDDPDLAGAGKVIEIDTSGNAKTVKGTATDPELKPGAPEVDGEAPPPAKPEPQPAGPTLKSGEISQRDACQLRMKAQCGYVVRCLSTGDVPAPISCEEMAGVCEGMPQSKAPYSRKDAEACAQAVASGTCPSDFNNPAALDPEASAPACREVRAADAKAGGRSPYGGGGAGRPGFDPGDLDIGGAPTGE